MAATGVKRAQTTTPGEGRLQSSLEEKARDLEARLLSPLGAPTAEQTSDHKANWGEFVLVSEVGVVVKLPSATRGFVGRIIPVKNLHATEDATVSPAGSDTIDGTAGDASVEAGRCHGYLCVAEGEWIELWGPPPSSGGWVWLPTSDKTSNYTCTQMYELVQVDESGGSYTVTLPTIASSDVGKMVAVKHVGATSVGTTRVNAAGGQTMKSSGGYVTLIGDYKAIVFVAVSATAWAPIYDYEEDVS